MKNHWLTGTIEYQLTSKDKKHVSHFFGQLCVASRLIISKINISNKQKQRAADENIENVQLKIRKKFNIIVKHERNS